MFTTESIIQIIITLFIASGVSFYIIRNVKIASAKAMLLGIGLILFSENILKEMVKYGLDEVFIIIGFGIVIGGVFNKDKEH
jgi:Na+/phosphate symporter